MWDPPGWRRARLFRLREEVNRFRRRKELPCRTWLPRWLTMRQHKCSSGILGEHFPGILRVYTIVQRESQPPLRLGFRLMTQLDERISQVRMRHRVLGIEPDGFSAWGNALRHLFQLLVDI